MSGAMAEPILGSEQRGRGLANISRLSPAAQAALLGIAYYVSGVLCLRFALVAKNVTPIWLPTGIAVMAFLYLDRRAALIAVFLGASLINLPISHPFPIAFLTAAGNTLAPWITARLLMAFDFDPRVDRPRDALSLVIASLLGMSISATVGTASLWLSDAIAIHQFGASWAVWWTGDAMGVLLFAPLLLAVRSRRAEENPASYAEAVVIFPAIALVAYLVSQSRTDLLFLVLPLVLVAAWRFHIQGAAPAALVATGVVTWAAISRAPAFSGADLAGRMLLLQSFNVTVTFSALLTSSVVTQRAHAAHALSELATNLEEKVAERTRQLAEAQEVAGLGSWDWDIQAGTIHWSDEMFNIYGHEPQSFRVTLDKALEQVVDGDRSKIRANLDRSLQRGSSHDVQGSEYRIRRPDGTRTLRGHARMEFDERGRPLRMIGTVQDITDLKRAEQEHVVVQTIQHRLLMEPLPSIPGMDLIGRYRPASSEAGVGGDWFDSFRLPDGQIALCVGDVVGRGVEAASVMAQLRLATRSFCSEDGDPVSLVERLDRSVRTDSPGSMATFLYARLDPIDSRVQIANAGHLPPLVLDPAGGAGFLATRGAPLGVRAEREARTLDLEPGSTLLLYTDGLIEKRDQSIEEALEGFRSRSAGKGVAVEAYCDELMDGLGEERQDDAALLAVTLTGFGARPVNVDFTAEPRSLHVIRDTVRRWLHEAGASDEVTADLVLACEEACCNVIEHAYGASRGEVHLVLSRSRDEVEISVRDDGSWRSAPPAHSGRGMDLMEALADGVEVETTASGTTVKIRKSIEREDAWT